MQHVPWQIYSPKKWKFANWTEWRVELPSRPTKNLSLCFERFSTSKSSLIFSSQIMLQNCDAVLLVSILASTKKSHAVLMWPLSTYDRYLKLCPLFRRRICLLFQLPLFQTDKSQSEIDKQPQLQLSKALQHVHSSV